MTYDIPTNISICGSITIARQLLLLQYVHSLFVVYIPLLLYPITIQLSCSSYLYRLRSKSLSLIHYCNCCMHHRLRIRDDPHEDLHLQSCYVRCSSAWLYLLALELMVFIWLRDHHELSHAMINAM